MMKVHKYYPYFAIASLIVAQLGCQFVRNLGSRQEPAETIAVQPMTTEVVESPTLVPEAIPQEESPTQPAVEPIQTEFPLPPGAENVMVLGEGMVNFQVKMSLKEAIGFYQADFTQKGLTERSILHVETENTFNMVFDGALNGKAIVVQGVDLGDGTININIRYEDV